MRHPLAHARRKAQQLAKLVRLQGCDQPHIVEKITSVWANEAAPERPELDAPATCRCGAVIDYWHTVYKFRWKGEG